MGLLREVFRKNFSTNSVPSFFKFHFVLFYFICGHSCRIWKFSRLGIESEPQVPAYTTATATLDLSCICSLHHSSRQCWILNPLSETRDQTCVLMDSSQISFRWATMATPQSGLLNLDGLASQPLLLQWAYHFSMCIPFQPVGNVLEKWDWKSLLNMAQQRVTGFTVRQAWVSSQTWTLRHYLWAKWISLISLVNQG